MTAIIAIAGVIALAGLVFVWLGIRRLAYMRLASGIGREVTAIVLLLIAAMLLLISSNLAIYNRLVYEVPVATIHFTELGPLHYLASLRQVDALDREFEMRGDEWQLDARVLKWQGVANVLGLDTHYRLNRLAGRYTDIDQERQAARSIHQLGEQPEVDLWKIASDHQRWLDWLVDAAYGSAVYLPMSHAAEYEISVSQSGLVARPVNAPARQAVSRWIGL